MPRNESPDGSENGSIGQKIKYLRIEQNLTLAEVASATNLSASHLSQIERNKTAASLMTIASIAEALNVNVRDLFESVESQVHVRRADRRSPPDVEPKPLDATLLTGGSGSWQLQTMRLVIQPGASSQLLPDFAGEVLGFVLEGEMSIELADELHALREGDSIHFDAAVAQRLCCRGEAPCTMLWCCSPPQRGIFVNFDR